MKRDQSERMPATFYSKREDKNANRIGLSGLNSAETELQVSLQMLRLCNEQSTMGPIIGWMDGRMDYTIPEMIPVFHSSQVGAALPRMPSAI